MKEEMHFILIVTTRPQVSTPNDEEYEPRLKYKLLKAEIGQNNSENWLTLRYASSLIFLGPHKKK